MFTVIIPTYNNLSYLKLCLSSIEKNSKFNHQIVIHVNEGTDGTLEYVKKNNLNFTYNSVNVGVCVAFNNAAKLAKSNYLVLGHDDMYFCPGWDLEFKNEIDQINLNDFFLSGTMVQPFNSYIHLNCGDKVENFDEKKLLTELPKIKYDDYQGTHWQPSLIPTKTWRKVNGFSEEFSPGLGSDPDFNKKLWDIGVRIFKGLGNCRVYHFSSVSLRKKAWNNGSKIFLRKWGISIKFFKKYYLRTNSKYDGPLKEPSKGLSFYLSLIICKLRLIYLKFID